MLHSLIASERGPLEVYLFVEREIPEDAISKLVSIARRDAMILVESVPYGAIGSLARSAPPAAWTRVFLPDLLSAVDRLIYLDADLIVTGSLRPLWSTDLSGHCIAAVTTVFPSEEWGVRHCSGLGLPSPRLYFNSGVLLMDLARLREGGYVSEIVEFASARLHPALTLQALEPGADAAGLRRHASLHPGELIFGDQDAMNAVLAGERFALHPRWNCMNQLRLPWSVDVFSERAVREALTDHAVRHFEGVGEDKPWHPDADPEARELYLSHRNRTPWPIGEDP
jgi:lipopolysaccharide biosynthesis glycosyltransferase